MDQNKIFYGHSQFQNIYHDLGDHLTSSATISPNFFIISVLRFMKLHQHFHSVSKCKHANMLNYNGRHYNY